MPTPSASAARRWWSDARDNVDVHPEVAQDGDAAQADRARTDDEHARAGLRVEAVDGMERDRERLNQARVAPVDARRQRDDARRLHDHGVRHPAVAEEAVDRRPQDATQLLPPRETQVAGAARRVGQHRDRLPRRGPGAELVAEGDRLRPEAHAEQIGAADPRRHDLQADARAVGLGDVDDRRSLGGVTDGAHGWSYPVRRSG